MLNRSRHSRTWSIVTVTLCLVLVSGYGTFAAISLSTSVPYTQSFDSIGIPLSNPAPSTLPVDFRVDDQSVTGLVGTYFSASNQTPRVGGANFPTAIESGVYNFGAGTELLGNEDRAVGFVAGDTSTKSANLYADLQNNTGGTFNGLRISYDVEKYRNGSNPAGFRIQLYYSRDGFTWTNAGPNFLTTFGPDADDNGFETAPGAVVSVDDQTLDVEITNGARLFLAWNYSVVSGDTTTNAPALAIDNISLAGITPAQPTAPSGIGNASPAALAATASTLLSVGVTPGANPASSTHAVVADLSSIGGATSQSFFDDGSHGDAVANDNVFSFLATVANGTSAGNKSLPFTVSETAPQTRSSAGIIVLTVIQQQPPPPSGSLSFNLSINPPIVRRGRLITLTASYNNQTNTRQRVSFRLRYASPCGNVTIGNIGPITVPKGARGSATLPFLVPNRACTGAYSLTLEAYVEGNLVDTTTATLTVLP